MQVLTRLLFLVSLGVGAQGTAKVLSEAVVSGSATLRVDLAVSAGQVIQVFVNDTSREPLRASIIPGVRHTYEFPGIVEDVNMLRFDPTDIGDADVVIHSVELVAASRTLAKYGPSEVSTWWRNGIVPQEVDRGFGFRSAHSDPILQSNDHVRLPRVSSPWKVVLHDALFDTPIQPLVWLLPVLALGYAVAGGGFAHLALIASTLALGPWLLREISGRELGVVAATVAVSRAAFLGESLRAQQIAVTAVAGASIAFAVVVGWAARLRRKDGAWTAVPEGPVVSSRSRSLSLVVAWIALGLLVSPNLAEQLAGMSSTTYSPQWDADNVLYWANLTHSGAVAFRDFWYTYGAFTLFDLPWPAGPSIRWAYETLMFGALLWGLWRLVPESRLSACLVVFLVVLAYRLPLIFQVERYLLGPAIVIGYLAARRDVPVQPWSLGPFWLATALALLFDPPQVLYAGPALLLLSGMDFWTCRPLSRTALVSFVRLPLLAGAGVMVLALGAGAWLAGHGQLAGFWGFYSQVADTFQYAAHPTLFDPAWPIFDLRHAMLLWPAFAMSIGAYELTRRGDRRLGEVLLTLGLLTFMTMQKHLVRPMEFTMGTLALFGSLSYVAVGRRSSSVRFQAIGAIFAGVSLAVLVTHGRTEIAGSLLMDAPRRALGSLRLLTTKEAVRRANDLRFAPERFASYRQERELIEGIRERWHTSGPLSVFMLSDAPIAYLMTGQRPVWFSNMYNTSPVYEQERMSEWLAKTPPSYVAFDPGFLEFDRVPTAVRVPIVVKAVIDGYVPAGRTGHFEVLRRRRKGESVPLGYWRQQLGNSINLGHLLESIDSSTYGPCQDGRPCEHYLAVTVEPTSNPQPTAALEIEVGGSPFEIRFALSPGKTDYIVPLSRLWVWHAAKAAGASVEIGRPRASSLVRLASRQVAVDKDHLY